MTTLRKSHVSVRGNRVTFRFRTKGRAQVRTALVDTELADAVRALLDTPGPRLFRYETDGALCNLTGRRLNDYVQEYMGEEFSCKDLTWGDVDRRDCPGGPGGNCREARHSSVTEGGERLGNTPTVARLPSRRQSSDLDGRTIRISGRGICVA